MAWNELTGERTRNAKIFQDEIRADRRAIDATLGSLHYQSVPGDDYDTEVNLSPIRVDAPNFDGWRIIENAWHYALGKDLANHGDQDGWVGFGGRNGSHWFKFRLAQIGYLHWPTRTWQDVGGTPNYDRTRLTNTVMTTPIISNDTEVVTGSLAEWADLWETPSGGSVSSRWRCNGDGIKEEITINQTAREWIRGNRPPVTTASETYFGFVFRLDWSDIPKAVIDGIVQDLDGDFTDDLGEIELCDALDNLLGVMTLSDCWVGDGFERVSLPLRKRFYASGGHHYLLVGLNVLDLLTLPDGDLTFDPTVDAEVGAGADDGVWWTGFNNNSTLRLGQSGSTSYNAFVRFTGITIEGTITSCYLSFYAHGTDSDSIPMTISADDQDNPSAVSSASDGNGRAITSATISWSPGGWNDNTYYDTPSLVTIAQELVDSYTISSDAVQFFLKNNGASVYREAESYDTDSSNPPNFHCEYTVGGGDGNAALAGNLRKRKFQPLIVR